MKSLSIGELSKQSGVKITTIRYYEKVGLIAEPERSSGGRRLYLESDIKRIGFIKHSRFLGFPLDAIREMLHLQATPEMDCSTANQIAERQLALVKQRISQLQARISAFPGNVLDLTLRKQAPSSSFESALAPLPPSWH